MQTTAIVMGEPLLPSCSTSGSGSDTTRSSSSPELKMCSRDAVGPSFAISSLMACWDDSTESMSATCYIRKVLFR